jgi:hypothetical protein
MAVESGNFINSLQAHQPDGTDPVSEGDDHIRLLKEVLKGSFPHVDTAVNAIHTSNVEPSSFDPGTVWFDTDADLLKIRNKADDEWVTILDVSTGIGERTLQHKLYKMGSFSGRWDTWTSIGDPITVTPVSETSNIILDLAGSAGVAGYGDRHVLELKWFNSDGSDLTESVEVVGFQHSDDAGNFEIIGAFNKRAIIDSPGLSPFTFQLKAQDSAALEAGQHIKSLTLSVVEVG